jgi:hypothetical protein
MENVRRVARFRDENRTKPAVAGTLITVATDGTSAEAQVDVGDSKTNDQFEVAGTFDRGKVAPGAYPAMLVLTPDDQGPVLSQPLTVDIRMAPWWPLLVIFLGIVVGRLATRMSTPLFEFQSKLYARVHVLLGAAAALRDPGLQALTVSALETVLQQLEFSTAADATLEEAVKKIEGLVLAGNRADRAANAIDKVKDGSKRRELEQALEAVRAQLRNGAPPEALASLAALESDIADALSVSGFSSPSSAPTVLALPTGSPDKPRRRPLIVRALDFLAGTRGPSLNFLMSVIKPLFFLALLVLLGLIGFHPLYIKGPAGFGSAGLFDLLGLFMWGLTAEVAQSTLQKLPK